jgi:23S rRNA G2445 N2-methylase RlmL
VRGSDTQWSKNVPENPQFRVSARGMEGEFEAVPVTDAQIVSSVVEQFREKYGTRDVKKYYSSFDVAVWVDLA